MYTGNMRHKTQNEERYTNNKSAQKTEKLSKKYPPQKPGLNSSACEWYAVPVSDTALTVLFIVKIVKPGKSSVGDRGKGNKLREKEKENVNWKLLHTSVTDYPLNINLFKHISFMKST